MSLEIKGKLFKILEEQKGEGKNGPWVKQEIVVETMDQYPKKVCFSVWGDKTNELKQFAEGQKITVSFNVESREYNQRWYTDLRAWRFSADSQNDINKEIAHFTENDIPPETEDDGLPF